jgi:DNA polymerase I-like protein with 3'-5' exonuclease and polymerase domains
MNEFIEVSYETYSTPWFIRQKLTQLEEHIMLSFDTETRSVYSKEERKEAKILLKNSNTSLVNKKLSLQVVNSSGLSFPSLVTVTHFIFGISDCESVVLIAENMAVEMIIWHWLAKYEGLIIVHNSLFDFKLMYHRIRQFPKQYKDTALLSKTFINHADNWKAKIGLKEQMGAYYDPRWQLMNNYEPENLKDYNFLRYCAIDGAATFKLYEEVEQHIEEFSDA